MTARLLRAAPYFPVADAGRSARYYADVLGFEIEYLAGDPPVFGIVARDGLALMFRRVADPSVIRPSERQGGTWDAFFWVSGVTALHEELTGRGADAVYPPTYQPGYGMLEFAIRDPDGHVLGFGEPADSAASTATAASV